MTRPKAHETDEIAKWVFRSALPAAWIPREQHPDYRIDFVVEVFENEQPTGVFFSAQLKGTTAPRFVASGTRVSVKIETEHLAYWVEKVPFPALLVVVDATQKHGWWIDLQRYAREELKSVPWKSRSTVNIHVPVENRIENTTSLRSAVQRAFEFLSEVQPDRISGALRAEQERLLSLDPRLSFDVAARATGIHIELRPNGEPVEFNLRITGKDAVEKAKVLTGFGGTVEFAPGEATISGSPIFDQGTAALSAISASKAFSASVRLAVVRAGDDTVATLDIPGTIRGANSCLSFESNLPESPFFVKMTLDCTKSSTRPTIRFDLRKWYGRPLLWLPYFSEIEGFYAAIKSAAEDSEGVALVMSCFICGNRLFESYPIPGALLEYAAILRAIPILRMARKVAGATGMNPPLPPGISAVHVAEVTRLHGLLCNGEHREPIRERALAGKLTRSEAEYFLSFPSEELTDLELHQSIEGGMPFFGQVADVGAIDACWSHLDATPALQLLRDRLQQTDADELKVEYRVAPESEYTLRRAFAGGSATSQPITPTAPA
jgi:hypothetical protein